MNRVARSSRPGGGATAPGLLPFGATHITAARAGPGPDALCRGGMAGAATTIDGAVESPPSVRARAPEPLPFRVTPRQQGGAPGPGPDAPLSSTDAAAEARGSESASPRGCARRLPFPPFSPRAPAAPRSGHGRHAGAPARRSGVWSPKLAKLKKIRRSPRLGPESREKFVW